MLQRRKRRHRDTVADAFFSEKQKAIDARPGAADAKDHGGDASNIKGGIFSLAGFRRRRSGYTHRAGTEYRTENRACLPERTAFFMRSPFMAGP